MINTALLQGFTGVDKTPYARKELASPHANPCKSRVITFSELVGPAESARSRWPDPNTTDADAYAALLRSAALGYAAHGFRVFPLRPFSSKPATKHGHLDATTDPDAINEWWGRWRSGPVYPYNVGVATGSGLFVIDVDGPDVEPPPPPRVVTPSGGWHAWFRGDTRCANRWRRGVDVKGEGGYVVAPPSVKTVPRSSDGESWTELVAYVWDGVPRLDALEEAPHVAERVKREGGQRIQRVATDRAVTEGFRAGERDNGLYTLACRLWRKHLDDPDAVRNALWSAWEASDNSDGERPSWRKVGGDQHSSMINRARTFIASQPET